MTDPLMEMSWDDLLAERDRVFGEWIASQVTLAHMAGRIADLEAQVQELREDL